MSRAPWVVVVPALADPDIGQPHFRCKRCGDYSVTVLPMSMETYAALAYAFVADHAGCEASPSPSVRGEPR